jgi:hypothetical protein
VREFRVIVIRPDSKSGGVTTQLEAVLAVNDEQNFELHTLIPFGDGLLVVFVKDVLAEMGGS